MKYIPTYGPRPPMVEPETFQWSDLGGRFLIFRMTDPGEMDIILRGDDDDEIHTFRVSSIDVPKTMQALIPWAQTHSEERTA